MSFKIIVEGNRACFTRPELKVERVSYDVPTPSALEGLLKSIYWKPAIRYVIDKIVVFNPIRFDNVKRNEVKEKILFSKVKKDMKEGGNSAAIYTAEEGTRIQRSTFLLKDVKYGIEFHFELTGICDEKNTNSEAKHASIIKRRLEKGQQFRTPYLGCSEFAVKNLELVDDFNMDEISEEILRMGDVNLGYMLYGLVYEDGDQPLNGDWENPIFSNNAESVFYRPHMINGVIDVSKYKEEVKC